MFAGLRLQANKHGQGHVRSTLSTHRLQHERRPDQVRGDCVQAAAGAARRGGKRNNDRRQQQAHQPERPWDDPQAGLQGLEQLAHRIRRVQAGGRVRRG